MFILRGIFPSIGLEERCKYPVKEREAVLVRCVEHDYFPILALQTINYFPPCTRLLLSLLGQAPPPSSSPVKGQNSEISDWAQMQQYPEFKNVMDLECSSITRQFAGYTL